MRVRPLGLRMYFPPPGLRFSIFLSIWEFSGTIISSLLFGESFASFSLEEFSSKNWHRFPVFQTDPSKFFSIFEVNGRIQPIRVFRPFSIKSFISFADVIRASFTLLLRFLSRQRYSDCLLLLCNQFQSRVYHLRRCLNVTRCSPFGKLVGIGSLPRVASYSPKVVSHEIVYKSSC